MEQVHLWVAALYVNFPCRTYIYTHLHVLVCWGLQVKELRQLRSLDEGLSTIEVEIEANHAGIVQLASCQYDLTTHVCWRLHLGCQGKRKPARLHNCWYACLTAKKQLETGLNICYQLAAFENKRIHKPALANLTCVDRCLFHPFPHSKGFLCGAWSIAVFSSFRLSQCFPSSLSCMYL